MAWRTPGELSQRWRSLLVAGLVLLVTGVVGLVILTSARPTPTGDEPHYLLIAQSIAFDGDIDLTNDYLDPQRVEQAYPGNTTLDPVTHAGVYREGGPMVPIHAVGLPLLLAPVYLLGQGWFAARVLMVVLTALTAAVTYLIAERLVPGRRWVVAAAVLVVSLSIPGIAFSNQIYPEIPAALVLASSVACLVRGRPTMPWLLAASALAALAPWIHLRFAILVIPIALAVLGRALGLPVVGGWRALLAVARERWARALVVLSPLVVSAVGVLVSNQVLFGSPSVNAAYRPDVFPIRLPFQPLYVWTFGVGSLLDARHGIAPYAPVVLVAFAAVAVSAVRWRWWVIPGIVACVVFYAVTTGVAQGGGYCPPGRWFVVFIPMTAIGLAAALRTSWRTWWVFVPTAAFSLAVTATLPSHFNDLYPVAGSREQLVPVARQATAVWPDVMVRRSSGLAVDGTGLTAWRGRPEGETDLVAAPQDGAGTMASGPDKVLVPAVYDVDYRVRLVGDEGQVLGLGQVRSGGDLVAEVPLVVPADEEGWTDTTVRVTLDGGTTETRVVVFGLGTVQVHQVKVTPADLRPVSKLQLMNGVPVATLWLAVIALLGAVVTVGTRWSTRKGRGDE